MAVHTTFSTGQWDTICTTAIVERHLACQCTCKQKPEHCNSKIHVYHYQSCTCQCKNQEGMANCGSGKKWDPRTCSCMCPRNSWRLCSTGYTYDFQDSWWIFLHYSEMTLIVEQKYDTVKGLNTVSSQKAFTIQYTSYAHWGNSEVSLRPGPLEKPKNFLSHLHKVMRHYQDLKIWVNIYTKYNFFQLMCAYLFNCVRWADFHRRFCRRLLRHCVARRHAL